MKKTILLKNEQGGVDRFEIDLSKKGADRYRLNGRSLTGVTTALSTIAKPNLIAWAGRLCASEAFKIAASLDRTLLDNIVIEILKCPGMSTQDAKKLGEKFPEFKKAISAHSTKSGKAMDVGKVAHSWVEEWAKAQMNGKEIALPQDEEVLRIVAPFLQWVQGKMKVSAKKNEFDKNSIAIVPTTLKVLASEQSVVSIKYFYGGTFDLVLELNGDKYVCDFKTSGGIYGREYAAQCAAYRNALEEMGWAKDIKGSIVIRSGKEGNDFEVVVYKDYVSDFRLFKAALTLHKEGYTNFDIDE